MYFKKKNVLVFSMKQVFDFITDISIINQNIVIII